MRHLSANRLGLRLAVAFLALAAAVTAFGAKGDVDTGFNPRLTFDLIDNYTSNPVRQPDGKIIVFGIQNPAISPQRAYFKRLNADGSMDTTFNCPACVSLTTSSVAVQPDGTIYVGMNSRVIRVDQFGNLDASFVSPLDNCTPNYIFPQTDGKVLIKCACVFDNPFRPEAIKRLNNNGSLDPTFPAIVLPSSYPYSYTSAMLLLPDGKFLAGGLADIGGWFYRYNPDGSRDNSFQPTIDGGIAKIELLPDGKYLIGGEFSTINGASHRNIAKLSVDGSVDASFSPAGISGELVTGLKTLASGQFYASIYREISTLNYIGRFVRFNADGGVDNTFSQTFQNPDRWVVDDSNRIFTFRTRDQQDRYFRVNTDGSTDTAFNPVIAIDGYNITAALQSDGKVVIGGEFGKANGASAVRISRVNADGTTDATFNAGTGFDVAPTTVAIQADGKILVSGLFNVYNGTPRSKLVRLNVDGSLDTGFNPGIAGSSSTTNIYSIVPQAGGKILIGGDFTTVNGLNRVAFARLNADASLDPAFGPVLAASNTVNTIMVQTDGKIMIGGLTQMRRLNADGTVDGSFSIGSDSDYTSQILQRSDGKYVISRTSGGGQSGNVVLLNNNGSRDFGFQDLGFFAGPINSIFVQPNGNVVFAGLFDSVHGRTSRFIGRVGPSGESDIYFPSFGANDVVAKLIGQPDGKIIFVGSFSGIEDVGRSGIARLTLSNRTRGTLFDYDGDGRADASVFRPSTNTWYELFSGSGSFGVQDLGVSGDIAAPADYDGDGKTDIGVFRPSLGDWLYVSSSNNTVTQAHWGAPGDIPKPADVTGDGRAELVAYRPSTGAWYRSEGGSIPFGSAGDKPVIGDFDGDGKNDPAIYRPSTGEWWYAASSAGNQHRAGRWGIATDIPAPGDFDGDGKTDLAVYRPSEGVWYIYNSATNSPTILNFGLSEDKPVAADYDGDGKADIAVYRPSTGIWYLQQSTAGFSAVRWGLSDDVPTENAFVP